MAKLRHVAINCENLDEAAKFYTDAFELEEVGRAGDMEKGGAVYLSDGVINVALIKITDPDFPNYKPEGLNHIGFVVDDVDAAVERVQALGATAQNDPSAAGAGATWEIKMKTPDGVGFDLTTHGWPGISVLH
jgi:catechol 2,3-dioxygenase-like lactoylglutathione lyase family enzyme